MNTIERVTPEEILSSSTSMFFQIFLIKESGLMFFWHGNGFETMDDTGRGFIDTKAFTRSEVTGQYGRAYGHARDSDYDFSGKLTIMSLPTFM